jgi:hypothetical protein
MINPCHEPFLNLETSDWITISEIVVSAIIGIWIVRTVQNKLTNKRFLKDHLIEEVKGIRSEFRQFFQSLSNGKIRPKKVAPWLKLMNIKIRDVMSIVNSEYGLSSKKLEPYQVDLRALVMEFPEFEANFQRNTLIKLNEESQTRLIHFQQNHSHLFNDLIIEINTLN